jgi:hypothetical protein
VEGLIDRQAINESQILVDRAPTNEKLTPSITLNGDSRYRLQIAREIAGDTRNGYTLNGGRNDRFEASGYGSNTAFCFRRNYQFIDQIGSGIQPNRQLQDLAGRKRNA